MFRGAYASNREARKVIVTGPCALPRRKAKDLNILTTFGPGACLTSPMVTASQSAASGGLPSSARERGRKSFSTYFAVMKSSCNRYRFNTDYCAGRAENMGERHQARLPAAFQGTPVPADCRRV